MKEYTERQKLELSGAANTTLKCLMDRFRDDGHEDAAAALEEVDFLMREYGFTRDDLTESAMELSAGLRRLVAEWVAGESEGEETDND